LEQSGRQGLGGVEIGEGLVRTAEEKADLGAVGEGEEVGRVGGQDIGIGGLGGFKISLRLEAGSQAEPGQGEPGPECKQGAVESLGLIDGAQGETTVGMPGEEVTVTRAEANQGGEAVLQAEPASDAAAAGTASHNQAHPMKG
jgi:hypothetical protein